MTESWLHHMDGPDGQEADLLTRLTYDRDQLIQISMEREEHVTALLMAQAGVEGGTGFSVPWFADACLRAHLWTGKFRHALTEEITDQVGQADPRSDFLVSVRLKAVELYLAWKQVAKSGPKGSGPTEAPIPSGDPETSATSEPMLSAATTSSAT